VSALDIVLLAIAVVLLLIVAVGWRGATRRARERDAALLRDLAEANQALAQAHASDNGWDRDVMEAAARQALGHDPDALHLVQVVDRPGTEDDEALFRAVTGDKSTEVRLFRTGDAWRAG
jgi:hypothetical protein